MRTWVWLMVVVAGASAPSTAAHADDALTIRVRQLAEHTDEPLLHLDVTPLAAEAEGGIMDGRTTALDLGPRARLAVEGRWWQTGLAPSMFAEDLPYGGWRAAAELSYDLGPFKVGVNASMTRDGDTSHRMVGLFAFRTFRLSRWMRAWIMLGVAYEQWDLAEPGPPRHGLTTGLNLGTTFR
ncbi:MAG TPA: hypothetical protein VFQ53_12145 [Kofleriaceae bacterium]|nr:hypothetical protein [Kofleriaceae bacterium]